MNHTERQRFALFLLAWFVLAGLFVALTPELEEPSTRAADQRGTP